MAFTEHTSPQNICSILFDNLQWLEQRIELTTLLNLVGKRYPLKWSPMPMDGSPLKNKLFNYSPDICGPIFGGGFNPSKPYIITVELHSEQLTWLSLSLGDLSIDRWFDTPEMMASFRPQKFLLISTMQPITPKTKWGMSTTFSQSHHQ